MPLYLRDYDLDEWVIEPNVGVGPLKFGMTLDEARCFLGNPINIEANSGSLLRPDDVTESYAFPCKGDPDEMIVASADYEYNENKILLLKFIDATCARFIYQGYDFLSMPLYDAQDILKRLDPGLQLIHTGCVSRELGIKLYNRDPERDIEDTGTAEVQSISVFSKKYYGRNYIFW